MNEERNERIGPSSDNWHSVRGEIANQHTRTILIINGGAAVALLAFLKEIWGKDPQLSRFVIVTVVILSFGVACAGISNWLRYETSKRYEANASSRHKWSIASNIIQIIPTLFFVVAVCFFAFAALHQL